MFYISFVKAVNIQIQTEVKEQRTQWRFTPSLVLKMVHMLTFFYHE